MKPPKVTSVKRLSPQQWYDQNVQNGNKLISDYSDLQQQLGMGKYFSFYNPNEYSKHPDGGFRSLDNPDAKVGDPNYNPIINYQEPAPPVRPQKPVVNVSPDHKPVEIGPNLTYNPNMGTYANSQTGKGVGALVQQYNAGGLVKKIKGYAGGGTTGYNERFQTVNQLNTQQNEQSENDRGNKGAKVAGAATSTAGILGYATKAKDAVQSGFTRDDQGYIKNQNERALNEVITPTYTQVGNKLKQGDYSGALKEQFLGAQYVRAAQGLLGNDQKDTKFNRFFGVGDDYRKNQAAKQEDIDAQNAATLQQRAIEANGRVRNATSLRDLGSDAVNTDAPMAAYNPLTMPSQSTSATGLTKSWRDAGNSIGDAFNGLGKKFRLKDGGSVKGPGTGKSDSINAKIKPRSFVVPVENAPMAEVIRATFLKAPKTKANLKQSGGTEVKLSNGEHLFSPEERKEIESYGIDIDALAPNAERNEEALKSGGNVNDRKKAIELKAKQDNYNYLKSRISSRSATPQERIAFDRLGKELAASSSPVTSGKKAPNLPKQKISADDLTSITSKLPVNNSENLYGNRTSSEIARSLQKPMSEGDQPPEIVDPNSIQIPVTQKTGKKSGFNTNQIIDYGIPLVQAGLGLNYLKKAGARPVDQLDSDYLNSINSAKGNLTLAQANARFGFTPEEQASINSQNQNLTNAGNYAARNFSGGSSANAFNLTRANLNDSYNRGLDSKVQNRNLIFTKQNIANDRQQYLDSLVANKVGMSNRLFNMKLDAWQQQQATGQGLLAAAAQNAIGAKQWNDELQASKQRSQMYNPQPVNI